VLLIDGEEVAGLTIGERTRIEVDAGTHAVRAAINWTDSQEVAVEVGAGETVRWLIEPVGGLWGSVNPALRICA
jgi:hypothetical protein